MYNWTVDEVITWLCDVVHLPKYSANFRRNGIRGKDMPRYVIYTIVCSVFFILVVISNFSIRDIYVLDVKGNLLL